MRNVLLTMIDKIWVQYDFDKPDGYYKATVF